MLEDANAPSAGCAPHLLPARRLARRLALLRLHQGCLVARGQQAGLQLAARLRQRRLLRMAPAPLGGVARRLLACRRLMAGHCRRLQVHGPRS